LIRTRTPPTTAIITTIDITINAETIFHPSSLLGCDAMPQTFTPKTQHLGFRENSVPAA
jgi:hypothetical protein